MISHSRSRSADPFRDVDRSDAYLRLRSLATKHNSIMLSQIAATLKTGGHFDKVVALIDRMLADLTREEADDEAHKKWCDDERANANRKIESMQQDAGILGAKMARMKDKKAELEDEIGRASCRERV